jgi:hypothetical protein
MTEAGAQTVTVPTAGDQDPTYPRATSLRVDRRGDLRVMQGLRRGGVPPLRRVGELHGDKPSPGT